MSESKSYRLYGTIKCKCELSKEEVKRLNISEEDKLNAEKHDDKYVISFTFPNKYLCSFDTLKNFDLEYTNEEDLRKKINKNAKIKIDELKNLKLFEVSQNSKPFAVGIVDNKEYLDKTYLISKIMQNIGKERLIIRLIKDPYLKKYVYNRLLSKITDDEIRTAASRCGGSYQRTISKIFFPKLEEIEEYYKKEHNNKLTEEEKEKFKSDYYEDVSKFLKRILETENNYQTRRYLYTHYAKSFSPIIPTEVEEDLKNNYYIDEEAQQQYEEYKRNR